ncbi:penicillin-binding protein 1A [Alcanivorax sp. 1008]|uniref:penicillin-binding protein 1A n=1 Tax=Alcanivorax sp. 1008 TaxID=2816853 RepID=UPI001DF3F3F6|nr:penicillin-binding protein 1A [Alcanivorax sp. 1008]MCC1495764.1 penicillin-binding protein 1A [Alcanivorax sp. 1008]
MQLRRPWWRWLLLAATLSVAGTIMVLNAAYLYLAPQLPPASQLSDVSFQIPLRVYSADGLLIGEFGDKRRTPLKYEQLPPMFVKAVLAAEDDRFFEHGGVDVRGLLRAFAELLRYREIRSGGSTITMQVARNFFLDREQKFLRKFNEIVLSLEIESVLSKEQIFELYMNKIFLGHRAYGAEAAAQVYYGKSISELDLPQWAMIAGLPKAPSAYNPITNPDRALSRRNWILRRMHKVGFIDKEQLDIARAAPVDVRYHGPAPELDASYLAEMVRREVVARFGAENAYTSGLRVYTTLEGPRQAAAVHALRSGLHEYDERHGWRGAEASLDIGELDPLPEPELVTDNDESIALLHQWTALLRPFNPIADLQPALIISTGEQDAKALLANGQQVTLSWENIQWARRYIDVDTVGAELTRTTDAIKAGDVVRLREIIIEGNSQWRLAQIPAAQSALVALDPKTGAVRSLAGGFSFNQSNFNRALQGQRQAGSALKPFIYTAGLSKGLTPASLINDAPIVFEDSALETAWRPTGASSRFYGPTRLREALYRSLNLVSIRLLQQTGISNTVATLKEFGLPTERFQRDLSLALGSAALTPMEMATGYSVFANGGFRVEPWFMQRIDDNQNNTLWLAPEIVLCDPECPTESAEQTEVADTVEPELPIANPKEVVSEQSVLPTPEPIEVQRAVDARYVWLMDSMLKDVVRRGTAYRVSQLGRRDLAGKTGTTNDQVDAWFVGYSPALVAAVWVGFDEPTSLGRGEYGGRAALPIWMEYMTNALQGVEEQQLPQPAGIVTARINTSSGKLARPGDADAIFEYFIEGTVPEQDSNSPSESIHDDVQDEPEHLF